jgi:hypothetical protein
MGKYNIMRNSYTRESRIDPRRCHFKLIHVGHKKETLIRDESSQDYSENVKKTRAMAITPPFHVGDNTHNTSFW